MFFSSLYVVIVLCCICSNTHLLVVEKKNFNDYKDNCISNANRLISCCCHFYILCAFKPCRRKIYKCHQIHDLCIHRSCTHLCTIDNKHIYRMWECVLIKIFVETFFSNCRQHNNAFNKCYMMREFSYVYIQIK